MNSNPSLISPKTVKIIAQLLKPFVDEGVVTVAESKEVQAQLKHLAAKGTLIPPAAPRLITMQEAADILAIGLANFKKLEKSDAFPFKRRMIGSSVRFLNLDVIRYVVGGGGNVAGTEID
jgi:predicted DNA-binding transcriptional regulator AlpA